MDVSIWFGDNLSLNTNRKINSIFGVGTPEAELILEERSFYYIIPIRELNLPRMLKSIFL